MVFSAMMMSFGLQGSGARLYELQSRSPLAFVRMLASLVGETRRIPCIRVNYKPSGYCYIEYIAPAIQTRKGTKHDESEVEDHTCEFFQIVVVFEVLSKVIRETVNSGSENRYLGQNFCMFEGGK